METVTEINIFSDDTKGGFGRLYDLLCRESLTALSRPLSRVKSRETALSIIAAVADGKPPAEIVNLLAPERQPQKPIQVELELYGKAADAERADWDSTDWDWGCNISGCQQTLTAPPPSSKAVIAAVKFAPDSNNENLGSHDVALAAKTFAKLGEENVSVVLAYLNHPDSEETLARIAVHTAGYTSMTAEFNTDLAPDHILDSLTKLKNLLVSTEPQTLDALAETVTVKGISVPVAEATLRKNQLSRRGNASTENHLQGFMHPSI